MKTEEDGERVKIQKRLLEAITEIYDLANPKGILSVRFTNTSKGKRDVRSSEVATLLDTHKYQGVARVGTQLEKKILNEFVWGPKAMTKPLLVIVMTDGSVSTSIGPLCWSKTQADPELSTKRPVVWEASLSIVLRSSVHTPHEWRMVCTHTSNEKCAQ